VADSERLRIAVFIDFDNIEIGVKNTLSAAFDAGLVLEALKERGEVVSKTAYSDWQRAGGYSRALTQHAIRMVQRNLTPGGDKNGADINLALDALEMAFTHPHINAFVIVGGDSDFISLVEKLKQYDKKVFVVGGRQFTSVIMQRNCHEFIAYENLPGVISSSSASSGGGRRQGGRDRTPIEQALPLVTRALKVLSEREVSPQLGLLKSTLLQLDSTFSERTYGAGSFRDFVQKLEKVGVVKVHHGKGGLLVELAEAASLPTERAQADEPRDQREAQEPSSQHETNGTNGSTESHVDGNRAAEASPALLGQRAAVIGTAAEGLREFRRILSNAVIRRWPLYLRNVKQAIRQTEASFDERAYGFGNLTDLLRAAHREGIVRVDRDRQGVIRVFQGSAAAPASGASQRDADVPESPDSAADTLPEEIVVPSVASEIGVPLLPVEDERGDEAPGEPVDQPGDEEQADAAPSDAPKKRRARAPRTQTGRSRRKKSA
jgi:uncharacterized LabA/DUF88 family protein